MDRELQVLAPELIAELQEVLSWYRNKKQRLLPYRELPLPTTQVYIARTPTAGIPARDPDIGSGSPGSGTGTESAIADVFWATCNCYYIDDTIQSDVDIFKMDFDLPVYNLGKLAIPGRTLIFAVLDATGKWIALPFDFNQSAIGFWARLTNKTYVSGGYIQYSFEPVSDSNLPSAITWTDGGPSAKFAYEVNNVGVPVALSETPGTGTGTHTTQDEFPTIVWMTLGKTGTYYLFSAPPRWEIVQIESGGPPTYLGHILEWNQSTQALMLFEKCLIIDANALP